MSATSAKLRLNLFIDSYQLHCLVNMTHMARSRMHHFNLTYSVAQKIFVACAFLLAPAASAQVSAVLLEEPFRISQGASVGAVAVTG